jgi:hypothetical protein
MSTTIGGNWLTVVNVPMSQANEILNASYQLYQHVKSNTHPDSLPSQHKGSGDSS